MQNFGNDGDGDPRLDWDQNTKNVRFNEGFDEEAAAMGSESEFELLEGDVSMTMVNGIPTIAFSGRIKEILFKEMELTIVLKLLGRSIGYNALHNHILSLWKPAKPFHLMDITNGYFLVKFQDNEDYNRVLTQGQ
ncbi:hypothetical protein Goshw_017641 [Gossypium schwendimanii]|uniref:DUF4283 domain-containing protein n=1 Tax=Gossypium schwendimanii TaxID=34291 RepID=A0A7J9LP60_GOSSC|nr:hypothetical protein [Gossypium schwendimanii]